jgi:threonine synthase
MTSFDLACGKCGHRSAAVPLATLCPSCAKPLLVRYDLDALDGSALGEAWRRRPCDRGMWRFRELLPIAPDEEPVTLGEGATPLLPLPESVSGLGGVAAYVKDEGRNPTGSFKDRGLSAAVTRAVLDGATAFVIPSAGNAGVSLAAYASRAGFRSRVYLPADTPSAVVRRARAAGAEIRYEDGLITDCGRRAREYAARSGAFDVSTLREPYRIEGKKTMMLEIVQALDGRPPDAIIYPTGGGTGLIGSWKALGELQQLGSLEATTRLYAVQAEGCAPIVRAFERGQMEAEPWVDAQTAAFGLRVPGAIGDFLILQALRESGGSAIAVPDEAAQAAADELGRCGLSASIEGGATLVAARELRATGELAAGDLVVLFNTAHALVY